MSVYVPDRWVVLKITSPEEAVIYKILAGWYGGYAGSNSWKLSSGIVKVEPDNAFEQTHYHNSSGSTYICSDHSYGLSGETNNILNYWLKSIPPEVSIEVMPQGFKVPDEDTLA